jgi:plasmid replication initiation protein
MSATAQKLAALAMSMLPPDLSSLTASFSFKDFQNAIGAGDRKEQYKLFKETVDECLSCIITVETEPDRKGRRSWEKFHWIIITKYNEATEQAQITFAPEIAEFLAIIKWMHANIHLKDPRNLPSPSVIPLLEIAESYRSMAELDGNEENA